MKKAPKNRTLLITLAGLLLAVGAEVGVAQRKSQGGKEPTPGMMIKESSLDYRLWEGFSLVRKANDGEAPAQHELGLRYLQGRGFLADTAKAASWMQKSADQDFDLAHFNLGILGLNGWGVPWNPFGALRHFRNAGRRGMPEANFILGLMYTEDLVVRQNWRQAYALVKKAADAGFDPALKALTEFQKRGITAEGTTSSSSSDSPSDLRPLFIDFNVDTSSSTDDSAILNDLIDEGSEELKKALGVNPNGTSPDSSALVLIQRASDAGSPEARTLLGRFREKGVATDRDPLIAAAQYLVAVRNESSRAMELLWNLANEPGFAEELESRAKKQSDPVAQFVWAGLVACGIDQRLSGEQALKLLQSSAQQNYVDAIVELGLCYQSGRWVPQDRSRALKLWETAAALGSREALVRFHAVQLFTESPHVPPDRIAFFKTQAEEGSILAQVALAYCYERGLGIPRNSGTAAQMYRNAAQRGSQSAYEALKRMHDAIRPKGAEWEVG
ncbi:MAG: tetratricopeptide repeat protein [Bacteroidota bacterium]